MSPIYVSETDKNNERAAIKEFGRALKCAFVEFKHDTAACDWLATRDGAAVALLEIKTRSTPSDHYPTYMIDQQKLDTLAQLAELLGIHPILVVVFTDGIRWLNVTDRPWPVAPGGRADRGDPSDLDLVYYIPHGQLRRVA